MFPAASLISLCFLAVAYGQQIGTQVPENHPTMSSQKCTASGCTTQSTSVVLDSNWRWLHSVNSTTNCYTGNAWDATLCPDPTTCTANCALDGADYSGTYGISTSGNALTLKFVTGYEGANIGSRVYLMANASSYQMFQLLNQEFSFDVDMSNLGCGLNGALYLSEMPADGGVSSTNKAGAKYGTGYCDSQCPHDMKFIGGLANIVNWTGAATDPNSGAGTFGTCCNEMDIWEANKNAAAYTPHVCTSNGKCSGTDCGDGADRASGLCDKDGCDFNSYRMGDQTFLGPGKTVDTNSKFTVVTQFIATSGTLSEIRRIYVQNGKVIQNSNTNIPGIDPVNSITDSFCTAQKTAFGDTNSFESRGGLAAMGKALARGMVLALSIWDDHTAGMYWLDSTYPTNASASQPGVVRGPCSTASGEPTIVESTEGSNQVVFSNIKWGDINSTFSSTGSTGSSTPGGPSSTTTTSPPGNTGGACATHWSQCGGIGFAGSTCCESGTSCQTINPYYSQCL
ncbi:exocellulase [Mycena capillaripes]|nr:exocellulase [Mycena capillaripes]